MKPAPARVIVYCDAPMPPPHTALRNGWSVRFGGQEGFCKATRALWHWASAPGQPDADPLPEFTFWLEHDFVFLRPVDLSDLADVLRSDKHLAQMQLMRTPVNADEVAAGGLYEYRRDDYKRIDSTPLDAEAGARCWLHHNAYFTTNPSLMRTDFMMWNHWPDDDESHCEGRFGIDLVERGFYYGAWGSGEAWVEHVGVRTGFGY